jgi:DNA polymerase-3 subunit delta
MIDRLKSIKSVSVEDYPELKPQAVLRFISDEATARGLALGPGAARALADLAGSDTLALSNELDKLALYVLPRGRATIEDVSQVCSDNSHARVFELNDAVLDGDIVKARQVLETLLQDPHQQPAAVLNSLFNAYRTHTTVVDLLEAGASPEEIGKAARIPWEGLRDRAISRAKRLGPQGIRQAWELLVEADRAHKTGQADEEVMLELTIGRLCALSPRPAR